MDDPSWRVEIPPASRGLIDLVTPGRGDLPRTGERSIKSLIGWTSTRFVLRLLLTGPRLQAKIFWLSAVLLL